MPCRVPRELGAPESRALTLELPAPVKQGVKRQNREKHPPRPFCPQTITAQAGYVADEWLGED